MKIKTKIKVAPKKAPVNPDILGRQYAVLAKQLSVLGKERADLVERMKADCRRFGAPAPKGGYMLIGEKFVVGIINAEQQPILDPPPFSRRWSKKSPRPFAR